MTEQEKIAKIKLIYQKFLSHWHKLKIEAKVVALVEKKSKVIKNW